MYKFYLEYKGVKTEIREPVGYDGLELVLKRNDKSHGIDVEYSDMTLKFYGDKAVSILESAYNDDIDNIITFTCENDGEEEYRGQLDFEAYGKVYEDGYCYITAKVAEIGIQVLFNNRIEQKVDIDSSKAFDDSPLPTYPMLKHEIELPNKKTGILSKLSNIEKEEQQAYFYYHLEGHYDSIIFQPGVGIDTNEFDTAYDVENRVHFRIQEISPHIFFKFIEDKTIQYGNTELNAIFDFHIRILYAEDPVFDTPEYANTPFYSNEIDLCICKNDTVIYTKEVYSGSSEYEFDIYDNITLNIELKENDTLYYYFIIHHDRLEGTHRFDLRCLFAVNKIEIEIKSLTSFPDTTANVSFIHETLSRITESITENQITVKSDYYGRTDGNVSPTETNGPGSFRALSTGLRIRNIKVRDEDGNETDPKLTLSFSDAFKSLQAIDNIGFGFVKEGENWYLRIENWAWFYKNDAVFEIRNPGKIERGINPNALYSTFKCGYKKYETESFNGLDAIHTEREYRTRLKLKKNESEQKSDMIADGYTIEYTRRKSTEATTDWRYDNDVFIFCLLKSDSHSEPDRYVIDLGATDTNGTVISPDTIYNIRISPARMAKRWLDRLLSFGFGKEEELIFTSGTGNLQAEGRAYASAVHHPEDYPDNDGNLYVENQDFTGASVILLPELIKISDYPVKVSEYKAIKDNPYGIISVDDIPCFISEIKYKKQKNTASFVLIPKKA
ncbi:MAG: hypothetical protein FWF53_06940 [Candidatus Azobacteroides sp.]|nr:hypothetical protein [Candidatus Azobacteroides sp.]